MPFTLRAIYENIFWPAAAGNVLWSLFQILFVQAEGATVLQTLSNSVILLAFGFYLTVNWLRLHAVPETPIVDQYWVYEGLHLTAIVTCAIATPLNSAYLPWIIFGYFAVTTAGHLSRAWVLPGEKALEYPTGRLLLVNGLGLGIVLAERFLISYYQSAPPFWLSGVVLLPLSLVVPILFGLFGRGAMNWAGLNVYFGIGQGIQDKRMVCKLSKADIGEVKDASKTQPPPSAGCAADNAQVRALEVKASPVLSRDAQIRSDDQAFIGVASCSSKPTALFPHRPECSDL